MELLTLEILYYQPEGLAIGLAFDPSGIRKLRSTANELGIRKFRIAGQIGGFVHVAGYDDLGLPRDQQIIPCVPTAAAEGVERGVGVVS